MNTSPPWVFAEHLLCWKSFEAHQSFLNSKISSLSWAEGHWALTGGWRDGRSDREKQRRTGEEGGNKEEILDKWTIFWSALTPLADWEMTLHVLKCFPLFCCHLWPHSATESVRTLKGLRARRSDGLRHFLLGA